MAVATWQRRRTAAAFLLTLVLDDDDEQSAPKQRRRKRPTRQWILRREERSVYYQLVQELALEDLEAYRNFFRVSKEQFHRIVKLVRPSLEKEPQPFPIHLVRPNVSVEERVAVALRFLATGESFHSLEYSFRITRQHISEIVSETCTAIYEKLGSEVLKVPKTEEEWKAIAESFNNRWNFPNGIGAIDGKRVLIQQPGNSGSHFYDYKGHNSVLLLAIFGADYKCLWANVGANGRASDASIWKESDIKQQLSSPDNPLNLPPPQALPGRTMPVPYLLTGDDAFSLTTYLLKPFPLSGLSEEQRVYNYRLSRMRRISENGFGILVSRWRVYRSPIQLPPKTVTLLVLVTLVLHNYLGVSNCATDMEDALGNVTPAPWRAEAHLAAWEGINVCGSNNYSNDARLIREEFKNYFNYEGAVPWQWQKCGLA